MVTWMVTNDFRLFSKRVHKTYQIPVILPLPSSHLNPTSPVATLLSNATTKPSHFVGEQTQSMSIFPTLSQFTGGAHSARTGRHKSHSSVIAVSRPAPGRRGSRGVVGGRGGSVQEARTPFVHRQILLSGVLATESKEDFLV